MNTTLRIVASLATVALAGCFNNAPSDDEDSGSDSNSISGAGGGSLNGSGSGSSNSGGSATTSGGSGSAEGLWTGTIQVAVTDPKSNAEVVVLSDGSFYAFYDLDPVTGTNRFLGGIGGTLSTSAGTFQSSVFTADLLQDAYDSPPISFSGSYVAKSEMTGTISWKNAAPQTLDLVYDSSFDDSASLLTITGAWSLTTGDSGFDDSVTLTIGADGSLEATIQSGDDVQLGCRYTGTATPASHGNLFNITFQYQGPPCIANLTVMSGIIFLDDTTGFLRGAAFNQGQTIGWQAVGSKVQ